MRDDDDPRRLIDGDAGAPDSLRFAIRAARRDTPSAEQVATLVAAVTSGAIASRPEVAEPATPRSDRPKPDEPSPTAPGEPRESTGPAASEASAGAAKTTLVRLAGGAIAAGAIAVGAFLAARRAPNSTRGEPTAFAAPQAPLSTTANAPKASPSYVLPPSSPSSPPSAASTASAASAAEAGVNPALASAAPPPIRRSAAPSRRLRSGSERAATTASVPSDARVSASAAGARAPSAAVDTSTSSIAPDASPPPPPSLSEATLLREARELLDVDPERALALTQRHEHDFPNGQLVQEREALAIEALERLGRTDEARARARAFDQRFPNSVHRRTVESTGSP